MPLAHLWAQLAQKNAKKLRGKSPLVRDLAVLPVSSYPRPYASYGNDSCQLFSVDQMTAPAMDDIDDGVTLSIMMMMVI